MPEAIVERNMNSGVLDVFHVKAFPLWLFMALSNSYL